jgi:glyoxylate reductase
MVVDRIAPDLLAANPGLRIVANMAVGYDNIDPAAAADLGVWVTNTPGVLAETTADHAFALLMAAARHIALSDRDTRAGDGAPGRPPPFLGNDIHGATLGIVGLGEIGAAMAAAPLASACAPPHLRTPKPDLERDLGIERVPLDDLLARADFVCPPYAPYPETRGLIGAPELARMKPTAILVNTARGLVVDQDALIAALREGRIGGAALDVTDPEPLPLDNPLYSFPNVVITPHIASASHATRARMAEMAAENIIAVLAGREPLNPVNRPAAPRA